MDYRVRSAEERRRDIQDNARRLGINEAFISRLVETFYARIRKHALLGPIFEQKRSRTIGPRISTR